MDDMMIDDNDRMIEKIAQIFFQFYSKILLMMVMIYHQLWWIDVVVVVVVVVDSHPTTTIDMDFCDHLDGIVA